MGGASGAGRLLLNTKASQEAACSRAPAAIVPSQEPESRDAGVSLFVGNGSHLAVAPVTDAAGMHVGGPGSSEFTKNGSHLAGEGVAEGYAGQVDGLGMSGNAGTGSHLEEADAAEGHAGQVEGLGSSRNAGIGSHLAGVGFSDEPWSVMWRRSPSRRTESGLLLYGTASLDCAVQKTALWCTRGSSQLRGRARRWQQHRSSCRTDDGRKRKPVADCSGAGAAEVHEGEVAAAQMRRKARFERWQINV